MNKEEDKLIQQELVEEIMKASEEYPNAILYMETLMKDYERLEQENQQLEDRINKAIEYINWWVEDNKKQEIGLTISEADGLLLLLKGDKE